VSDRPGALLAPGAGVRLILTPAPWRAAAYAVSYLVIGPLMLIVVVLALALAVLVAVTLLALPVSSGAAKLVRWCAGLERRRAGLVGPPIEGSYRPLAGGLAHRAVIRWTDPATLRDCGYLVPFFPLLVVLDAAATILWLGALATVLMPAWYWTIPYTFPNGESGHGLLIGSLPGGPHGGGTGLWIGDLGTALVVSVIGVAVAVALAPAVTAVARLRVRLADRLLGPSVDPLAEAKRILAGPGPLPR
jgi:hypothetical protein